MDDQGNEPLDDPGEEPDKGIEDARPQKDDDDEEAVRLEPRQGVLEASRGEAHEYPRSVERRDRDQVEGSEYEINAERHLKNLIQRTHQVGLNEPVNYVRGEGE